MAFYLNGNQTWGGYAYIKVKAGSNMYEAMNHGKKTFARLDPE
jgi:hypothetical protein